VVASGTLTAFLGWQQRRAGAELDYRRQQLAQLEENIAKQEPAVNAFMNRIATYAQTHPDLAKALAKYAPPASTNAAPSAPAPLGGTNK
jgi:hypothetical protein